MALFDEINTLIGHLAWPGVVLGAVITFRTQIAGRIQHMRKLDTPAGSAEFEAETERLAELRYVERTEPLANELAAEASTQPSPSRRHNERLEADQLAETRPVEPDIEAGDIRAAIPPATHLPATEIAFTFPAIRRAARLSPELGEALDPTRILQVVTRRLSLYTELLRFSYAVENPSAATVLMSWEALRTGASYRWRRVYAPNSMPELAAAMLADGYLEPVDAETIAVTNNMTRRLQHELNTVNETRSDEKAALLIINSIIGMATTFDYIPMLPHHEDRARKQLEIDRGQRFPPGVL